MFLSKQTKGVSFMEIKSLSTNDLSKIIIPYSLPENFKVYVNDDGIILNHPYPGFREVTLPTYNDYHGKDGGYIALYTRDPKLGIYSVGDEGGSTIYVMGQVRVKGYYNGRIFIPTGGDRPYTLADNISNDETLHKICDKYFTDVESHYWVGGDTGGWFGISGRD